MKGTLRLRLRGMKGTLRLRLLGVLGDGLGDGIGGVLGALPRRRVGDAFVDARAANVNLRHVSVRATFRLPRFFLIPRFASFRLRLRRRAPRRLGRRNVPGVDPLARRVRLGTEPHLLRSALLVVHLVADEDVTHRYPAAELNASDGLERQRFSHVALLLTLLEQRAKVEPRGDPPASGWLVRKGDARPDGEGFRGGLATVQVGEGQSNRLATDLVPHAGVRARLVGRVAADEIHVHREYALGIELHLRVQEPARQAERGASNLGQAREVGGGDVALHHQHFAPEELVVDGGDVALPRDVLHAVHAAQLEEIGEGRGGGRGVLNLRGGARGRGRRGGRCRGRERARLTPRGRGRACVRRRHGDEHPRTPTRARCPPACSVRVGGCRRAKRRFARRPSATRARWANAFALETRRDARACRASSRSTRSVSPRVAPPTRLDRAARRPVRATARVGSFKETFKARPRALAARK